MILVCLDRDGTLIRDTGYLGKNKHWETEVEIFPEVPRALNLLQKQKSIFLTVISNQSGVAKNYFGMDVLEAQTKFLKNFLKNNKITIDSWHYCPYVGKDYLKKYDNLNPKYLTDNFRLLNKRKPGIGMIKSAVKDFNMKLSDFKQVYFIGDKETDVQAGLNATGKGILIKRPENFNEVNKIQQRLKKGDKNIFLAENLLEASNIILKGNNLN